MNELEDAERKSKLQEAEDHYRRLQVISFWFDYSNFYYNEIDTK